MKKRDPTGTIIGIALLPVLFIFIYLGKPETGFTACIVLAASMVAIYLKWKWRRYIWFWLAIVIVLCLNIPLLFVIQWPQTNVPTIAYSMPLGIIDFLLFSGAIRAAKYLFGRDASDVDVDGSQ